MPVIADTAYPRLSAEPGTSELEAFTLEATELAFARARTRQPGPRLAMLVLLKAFQHLGYAVRLADVPAAFVSHVAPSEAIKSPLAREALDRIAALYRIEDTIRGRPPDQRLAARATYSSSSPAWNVSS